VAAPPLARRQVLPGGAVLLVAERPEVPIAVIDVYLRAGSALDPPGEEGLASLTASALTRGTVQRSGPELDRAIEFVGGSLEAGAGRDGTTVSLNILTKDLALGLDLLAEVLLTPTFPPEEVRHRIAEVQAALRQAEENPEVVAGREIAALLYPGHPYGRPREGTSESVGRLTRDQLVAFHRQYYRPDAAIIAVVGDVRAAEIRRELLARLGGWTAPPDRPPAIPEAPARAPAVRRAITRDLSQATAILGRPGIRQGHPDFFPLVVASYVLGGGSASRLYTSVREERGLAYYVGSSLSPGRHGAALSVSLQTRNDAVDEALDVTRREMARLGAAPVSAAELARAKAYLVGSFPLRLDTSGKLARFLVGLEEHGLGLDYPDRYARGIRAVTAADVHRVARAYLDPAQFSQVVVSGTRR
jgi:zinc protease